MKIFHKKFLDQQAITGNRLPEQGKGKTNYLLHQFLIWGSIFFIIFFSIKFYFLYA